MNERYARERLTAVCRMLYDRQLTVSAGGNMSVRINDEEVLITPSGRNKGLLEPEDMVLLGMDGEVLSDGKPSIEHKFHLALYNLEPDTGAVVHCHPLYCTALAVRGDDIRSNLTPEGVLLLGKVPTVKYCTPGSQALVDAVAACHGSKAMLMAKHGALTQGRTLEEAYNRMEELEFQAKLQLLAGDAKDLPKAEIKRILEIRYHGGTCHEMVRGLPVRREERQGHRLRTAPEGPRRARGEASRDAEGRHPGRGEGAGREGQGKALRGREEAVPPREARGVRLLAHQGRGLRLHRLVHARGHDRPRQAAHLRAHSQGQEPGAGDTQPRRRDIHDKPVQREAPRVVRDALPRAGRHGQGREVRRPDRQVRREGSRLGGARSRHGLHRGGLRPRRHARRHGPGRHPGPPLRRQEAHRGVHTVHSRGVLPQHVRHAGRPPCRQAHIPRRRAGEARLAPFVHRPAPWGREGHVQEHEDRQEGPEARRPLPAPRRPQGALLAERQDRQGAGREGSHRGEDRRLRRGVHGRRAEQAVQGPPGRHQEEVSRSPEEAEEPGQGEEEEQEGQGAEAPRGDLR